MNLLTYKRIFNFIFYFFSAFVNACKISALCSVMGIFFYCNPIFSATHYNITLDETITYRIILKLYEPTKLSTAKLHEISKKLHLPVSLNLVRPMSGGAYLVEMDPESVMKAMHHNVRAKLMLFNQVLSILNDDSLKHYIKYASPDMLYQLEKPSLLFKFNRSNFDYHSLQWDEFNAPGGVLLESAPGLKDLAWQLTQGSPSIIIAVIDSGVDSNLDLNDNVLPGWNFPAGNDDVTDVTLNCTQNGVCHGTHVAGTVAAIGTKGSITNMPKGMGPQLKILPENVFTVGGASTADIVDAIRWAVGMTVPGVPNNTTPAQVLNLSLGSIVPASCAGAQQEAVDDAVESAVVVVAAGNDNQPAEDYTLSNCEGVISVAATDPDGLRSLYSNYGSAVHISAPGGQDNYSPNGILSTTSNNAFIYISGTSMASPHVAGIAGLIYAYAESLGMSLTPNQVKTLLFNNVSPFGTSADPDVNCSSTATKTCGVGIVNAFAALKAVNSVDKAVFVPPSQSALNLQNHAGISVCPQGTLIPALKNKTRLAVEDNGYTAYWEIQSAGCLAESSYLYPTITSNPIRLMYGNNNIFNFIPPPGLNCTVIGNTSVGCQ